MPYVRKKGRQLVLVHGEREPQSGHVQQRVLFTIYSKPEALVILGKDGERSARLFEDLVTQQHPELRFDWKTIRGAIQQNLEILPDRYEYRQERLEKTFRADLAAFARQLFLADPKNLMSAANLIKEQRNELELVSELIDWRLELCGQRENEWNGDNEYYWRFSLHGSGVPPDAEELVASYYEKGDYRHAEAGFRLLTECFDRYSEGYNYLGLIALKERRVEDAVKLFEQTVKVGRTLFPKRISKKRYWLDLDTRPYIRGLRNLTLALNQAGRFHEALALCDRLDEECGDDITAFWHRAAISLNLGSWSGAFRNARSIAQIHPDAAFIEALALEALGQRQGALEAFLHGALNSPRAAKMLVEIHQPKPASHHETDDHNGGVLLRQNLHAYLAKPPKGATGFFKALLADPRVEQLLNEVVETVRRWSGERTGDRTAYDRMMLMQSRRFAEAEAHRLSDLVVGTTEAD